MNNLQLLLMSISLSFVRFNHALMWCLVNLTLTGNFTTAALHVPSRSVVLVLSFSVLNVFSSNLMKLPCFLRLSGLWMATILQNKWIM